jgi:hypothetical protein
MFSDRFRDERLKAQRVLASAGLPRLVEEIPFTSA